MCQVFDSFFPVVNLLISEKVLSFFFRSFSQIPLNFFFKEYSLRYSDVNSLFASFFLLLWLKFSLLVQNVGFSFAF